MLVSTETFYSSSNGDRWQLVQDGKTGRYAVRHEPSLSSGGEVSELAVPVFLARSGTSPQATALRELLHKQGAVDADAG
jgi:hypothetical protein